MESYFSVLFLSVLLQLAAAAYALWLIRITGLRYSWIAISAALLLMCIRRLLPLWEALAGSTRPTEIGMEIVGLVLSGLMLVGVHGIRSVFLEEKRAEADISRQLREKETLLKEVHHRIKNNISSVSSLLSLQAKELSNPEAVEALKEAQARVDSMAVLYQKLLIGDQYQVLSTRSYLSGLVDSVLALYPEQGDVEVDQRIEDFPMDTKKLFSLGIILNELLTNIMKYAFAGNEEKPNRVLLSLNRSAGSVRLVVQDNGRGFPEPGAKAPRGLGQLLVSMLCEQLEGKCAEENAGGAKVTVEFRE